MAVSQNKVPDDKGQPSNASNLNVQAQGSNQTATPSSTDGSTTSNAGTTTAGKSDNNSLKSTALRNKSPTIRRNPLGYLSSYTYQLTLYMITPDALNAFRAGGRRNINNLVIKNSNGQTTGGAFIVLQSGGINNTSTTRAPEFDTDFFIDNLQITHLVSPNENMAPTVSTKLSFNIIEPYGFSFLSKLRIAAGAVAKASKVPIGIPFSANAVITGITVAIPE